MIERGHCRVISYPTSPPQLCRSTVYDRPSIHFHKKRCRSLCLSASWRYHIHQTAAATAAATILAFVTPTSWALTDPIVETEATLSVEDSRIADIYDRVNASVVNIFDATVAGQLAGTSSQVAGNGSGFVYDKQGHVVTNYHVLGRAIESVGVENAKASKKPVARVVLQRRSDGVEKVYDGYLVGVDKRRDLLVLKVDVDESFGDTSPVTFGDSDAVRVGETVLSFGNPFGFEHSMTKGVISARNRGFQSYTESVIGGAFQIDAATNPGNSGGPLVDTKGRVIGVNTAIFTNTGVSARVGFALPSNTVTKVIPELIDHGEFRRPSLGIQPASDPVKQSLGVTDGVLIRSVNANGPSAGKLEGVGRGLSGVQTGDVIVQIENTMVHNVFDLNQALDQLHSRDSVLVTVKKNNQTLKTVEITLGSE